MGKKQDEKVFIFNPYLGKTEIKFSSHRGKLEVCVSLYLPGECFHSYLYDKEMLRNVAEEILKRLDEK